MDWNFAQIHLSLNHFPIVGIFFSIFALAWGMATRNYPTIRVGLSFIILSALLCIPVYLSGEPAEHQIEHLAGVSAEALEAHEDAALGAFVVVLATGTLAAL